ncbi:hypothetical protein SCHPADRAFT_896547 [Schizopora paradoxa]|uniref:Uncharacterized protein n=1 Tax=Schizopora paradoxa TaxID=27342 RepID=A0A0H2R198_9AGAM|nr:hypothetical protein SCHPADRAFT_896547 [Schizopora paradoxa]
MTIGTSAEYRIKSSRQPDYPWNSLVNTMIRMITSWASQDLECQRRFRGYWEVINSDLRIAQSVELDAFSLNQEGVPAELVRPGNFVPPGRSLRIFVISVRKLVARSPSNADHDKKINQSSLHIRTRKKSDMVEKILHAPAVPIEILLVIAFSWILKSGKRKEGPLGAKKHFVARRLGQ